MTAILFDPKMSDRARREALYAGQLVVYSPTPSSLELVQFARDMAREAFHPHDPEGAQFSLSVEAYVGVLAALKPRFIHHPRCKELLPRMLAELGCEPAKTYFDVPRMRTATHGGYLTAGLAYAFHPHRDTWYSAPMNQINWWIPMYEIEPANAMAFHLRYWSRPLRNGSAEYDYAKWTRESRQAAAQQVTSDTRPQPRPEEPLEVEPDVRVICPPGGILVFSAAHLHSTVPNTSGRTRFSIDFRTVNIDDVMDGRGAPNVDSACTGTTMGDYLRGTDLAHVPAELIDRYTTGNLHCLEHAASHAPSLH